MKTRSFFLVFAAAMLLSGLVSAQSAWDGALTFANVIVSQNPVMAGGNATIRFQLYDSYGYWLYNVNLQPSGSYPLLNVSPLSSYVVGQVNPGLNPGYYNYTFAVPASAPAGTYTLSFVATYYVFGSAGTVIATSVMPVTFYVQNKPVVTVEASSPQPSALYSGYNQTVQLLIENTGYGTARNVSISVSGEQGISILSSVTSFFISNLTRGSTVSEPVLVSSQDVGHAGILANIAYYSSNLAQRFSSTQIVNLSVAPAAQFSIASQGSGAGPGATDVPIKFVITNTGTSDAKQVQLSLETSYPITPVASTAYISDLPQGASANVTFLVNVDSQGVPGNYPVTMFEQWKQPNGAANQQFSGSNNYFVNVSSEGSSTLLAVVVVVIIIVVGAFGYRHMQQGKKAKPKK
jgi:hypothetical protein